MPELAEVEFARKRWNTGLGKTITGIEMHAGKRIFRGTDTAALARQLVSQNFIRSIARGKQILLVFSGNHWLGIHLGMSGSLRVEPPGFDPGKHDHLILRQRTQTLVFRDARQFGRVRFHHGKEEPEWWQKIGPALDSPEFTLAMMIQFIRRHGRAPIKAVLLNQEGFPGIGNWMADEILWRARVAPHRKGDGLNRKNLRNLWCTVRFVSRASLRIIGRNNDDPPKSWLLHERWRSGGKCPRHGIKLRRAKFGGRTTAWCSRCQR